MSLALTGNDPVDITAPYKREREGGVQNIDIEKRLNNAVQVSVGGQAPEPEETEIIAAKALIEDPLKAWVDTGRTNRRATGTNAIVKADLIRPVILVLGGKDNGGQAQGGPKDKERDVETVRLELRLGTFTLVAETSVPGMNTVKQFLSMRHSST